MSEELLAHRLKAALDVAPADPALRARVISSLPSDRRQARSPRLGWAGVVAAALAVATVAAMVFLGPSRPGPNSRTGTAAFSDCRLPVYGRPTYQTGDSKVYVEGFLDLAKGAFTPAAPSSIVNVDNLLPLSSEGKISYDRALDVWLPVPMSWIAPDGLSFAYLSGRTESKTDLHLRDLRTHSDRVLVDSKVIRLLGWVGSRLYYASGAGYSWGLWAVDPSSGQDREVVPPSTSEWWMVGPDAVWGSPAYTGWLTRYDVTTSTTSTWILDRLWEIVGVDSAGHPLVALRPSADQVVQDEGELALMTASLKAVAIGAKGETFPLDLTVIADGDRTWFSAFEQLWVYTPDTGLVVLNQSSTTAMPSVVAVAGGCV